MKPILALLLATVTATSLAAGELARRRELTLDRVLAGGPPRFDLDFLLADLIPAPGRRFTEFSGDLSGRYLEALAAAGLLERAAPLRLRALELQRPDGGFGRPLSSGRMVDDDMARAWGHGRLLVGLLDSWGADGDAETLEAARRLGDFLVAAAPRFLDAGVVEEFSEGRLAHGYICWTQNLEGLVELHRATGEPAYLELSREIAERISRRPGQHSHGWLTSLRGLVALAEATGEERYLRRAESDWEAFTASENVLLTGTIPEYFAPGVARDEGCSQADWVRLNLELWRRTGKSRYIDMAERALFNALFLNQFANGDFGHVQLAADGLAHGTSRAWWCCTLHGLRAFSAIDGYVFEPTHRGPRYVLPVDGELRGEALSLRADAELALEAAVRFEVLAAGDAPVRLEIRRPSWSGPLETDLGGESEDGGLVLERVWRTGERFTVRYAPLERREAGSLFVGPWLLAASEAASPHFFDEPHEHNRIAWESVASADRPSRRSVGFVPAGYPEQEQTLVLRPAAERLELPDGLRWQWSFRQERGRIERTAERVAEQSRGRMGPFLGGLLLGLLAAWFLLRKRR